MQIRVLVDNRVRVEGILKLGRPVVTELRSAFEHDNPDWIKKKRMRLATWSTPRTIVTWSNREDPNVMSFPRGGLGKVLRILSDAGFDTEVKDLRQYGVECPTLEHRRVLYPYQVDLVSKAIEMEQCIVRAPTGCISGNAIVELNRAGKSFRCSLKHLVRMYSGEKSGGKIWDPEIPTRIRMRNHDGFIRLGTVVDAYPSGIKKTYRVVTSSGKSVRATLDHRFLSEYGWSALGKLHVGDRIYIDGGERGEGVAIKKVKASYRTVNFLRHHPYAGRRGVRFDKGGWSVSFHRLVAEAGLNKMDVDHFIECIKSGDVKNLVFLNPSTHHVHHLDEDPTNNDSKNLVIMSPSEHHIEHGKAGGWKKVTARTSLEEIIGIDDPLEEYTFDVEVLENDHNFLANGFVVHNSGKTTALLAIAAQVQVPTLVIVHSKALLKQWAERVVSELGIEERNIGIIQGKNFDLRPITLSIQKTLSEVAANSEEVRNYFGCVIADECHMFGARTFIESVDPFPARYRIGASADHRRKDRKEFLIHDLFGDVAADISRDSLIKSQHVLDVEIRMVPTTFAAPWYGFSDDKNAEVKIDFVRLVKEMAEDPARNWEIFRIVRDEVAAGEQVLVMCHEREHCMRIAQALTGMGIKAGHLLGGPESAKEFEQTVQDLKSKKLKVGVGTYKAIGTGIDIPAVGVAVAATPIASNQQFFGQVRGRVCRISKGKTTARLYVMWDSNVYERHLKNVITWNNLVVVRDEAGAWIPATTYIKDLGI